VSECTLAIRVSSRAGGRAVSLRELPGRGGRGEPLIAKKKTRLGLEIALWVTACGLVSPLVIYAGEETMPIAALFAVAGGIATAIALAGRQLHAVLLNEALVGRGGTPRLLLAVGMMLLVILLVLLGAGVALLFLFRSAKADSELVLGVSALASP